jgi:cell division protein FtsW
MYRNYAHRAQAFIDAVQGLVIMMIKALDAPRRQVDEIDYALLWSVLILLFTGMVMVYSSSIAIAEGGRFTGHQPAYYLVRHGIFLCIGMVAAAVAFQVPLSLWQKYSPYLFMAGVVLLALVLIPGIGKDVNGARRWLPLGFANLQPSELMKLFAVLYAADYTVRKINVMHDLKQAFLPMFGAMAIVGMLLLKEPDFGALVVIISIAMGYPLPRWPQGAPLCPADRRPADRLCRHDHRLALPP